MAAHRTPPGSAAYTLDASHAVGAGWRQRGICGADGDAFVAGRYYPGHKQPIKLAATDSQTGERVLLVAVGDYLERSQWCSSN